MICIGEGKGWFVLKMNRIFLSFQTLPVTFYTNTHIYTHTQTHPLTYTQNYTKFIPIEEKSFIERQTQFFLHLNLSNYELLGIMIFN